MNTATKNRWLARMVLCTLAGVVASGALWLAIAKVLRRLLGLALLPVVLLAGCVAPAGSRWPAYDGQPHHLTNGAPIHIDWQTNLTDQADLNAEVDCVAALPAQDQAAARRAMAAQIRLHPACAWCGATNGQILQVSGLRSQVSLNAHHIKPVHVWPELAAAMTNLITLCRQDHFVHGHNRNWLNWNPRIAQQAAQHLAELQNGGAK